ncbi:MAG: hypothetical protein WCB12_20990 [Bryobacteraceae bacterium]
MKLTNMLVIVAACAAGSLGGALAPWARVEARGPEVVRASKFELVDAQGKTVARWEADSENTTRIFASYPPPPNWVNFSI